MCQDICRYVAQCSIYQQVKYETCKPAGFLQPLPIPSAIWEDLSMDFITRLPVSNGFTTIMVVVDMYSKGTHLDPLPHPFTTHKVTVLFLETICKLHGFPCNLVSHHNPIFISTFWWELFCLSGTKLRMSMAYHPQTDDQTKVLNRVLKQYLRSFTHDQPHHWYKFLSLAEWSYNTYVYVNTNFSPFEVTYGKPSSSLPPYLQGSSTMEVVDTILTSRAAIHFVLQRRLQKYQASMKTQADVHRRDLEFAIGDWVYVKLRPYRQTLVQPTYSKLSKCYYGLFLVQARIGFIVYHLQLPLHSKIHYFSCFSPETSPWAHSHRHFPTSSFQYW